MFVIQIYVQNHFWQSQRDSKTLWELFWNTKEKIIFSWKTFFFKKIFISKFFQKSLIGGDFDFLDEFDSVWDPKKHQKSFFKVLKWHQNNLRTILKLKRKNDFLMKIFFWFFEFKKFHFSQILLKIIRNCHSKQLQVVLEHQQSVFGTFKCFHRV